MNVQEQLSADQEEIAVHKRALVIMQSGVLEDCGACFVETCHIKFDAPVEDCIQARITDALNIARREVEKP